MITEDGVVDGGLLVPQRMPRGSNEVGQGHTYGADGTNITAPRCTRSLMQEGCDEVQDYLTGRPLPIAHYAESDGHSAVIQQATL